MLNKVILGVGAAMAVACVTLFWLLLSAHEANGQLSADLETAAEINSGNLEVIGLMEAAARRASEVRAAERLAASQAAKANQLILAEMENEIAGGEARLAAALTELTDEERDCADQPVPAVLIDSLRADQGSNADQGD